MHHKGTWANGSTTKKPKLVSHIVNPKVIKDHLSHFKVSLNCL